MEFDKNLQVYEKLQGLTGVQYSDMGIQKRLNFLI